MKEGIDHISLELFSSQVLFLFVWFGFFVGFVLSGVYTHIHPLPSEQCASNKLSGFGVTHLRIYQHSFSLYS